ncbi:sensor histidine kinase [Methylomonas sp. HYX-M1]|uniref:sensor histidine kinase n=1 Tax=Methylomonas sp. HYX-M1 TaxID=3139307 RepID=UPI00345B63F5
MSNPTRPAELFPLILGSTVHDIKNSLSNVTRLLQHLAERSALAQTGDFKQLQFETSRINHSLMQLLVMYKIDCQAFGLQIDEYPAIDILKEAAAQQGTLEQLNGQRIEIDCDRNLLCYCDFQHVGSALGAVLNNAQRYSRRHILLSAGEHAGFCRFCIEDDGNGYPEHWLKADLRNPGGNDWLHGNTGLGMYFAAEIAAFHQNRSLRGYASIDNASRFGGARFCLFLP